MSVKLSAAVKADNRKQQRMQNDDARKEAKSIGRRIDQPAAPPLRFVRRDEKCSGGGVTGTITTNPKQIDGVVSRAWMKTY